MGDLLTDGLLGRSPPYHTAQATVAERLRRAVLSGQLAPGSRLLQAAVAEDMKTSTTPVREALRELAGEGLLDLDPHRGVVVHQGRAEELEEVYRIRMLLEPVAIAWTIEHMTPDELAAAGRILDRMEREGDVAEWTLLNAAFHAVLAESSRSVILSSILRKLRNISAIYVASSLTPDRIAVANVEHRALLVACADRNLSRAQEIEVSHLRHTLEVGGRQFGLSGPPARADGA